MDFTKLSTVAVSSYSLTIENVVALGTILCREAVFWLRIPLFLLEAMMEVQQQESLAAEQRLRGNAGTELEAFCENDSFKIKYNRGGFFFNHMVEAVKFLFMHWNTDEDADG